MSGSGVNTVLVNGEIKHITELEPVTLSLEWTKLKNENKELYRCIAEANSGWRGFLLRLMGIRLPDGKTISINGINAKNESIYPELTMSVVEVILDSIGLKIYEITSLDQTDSLILYRIFEAVQQYAMYRDKNPALENECEEIHKVIRKHLNKNVIV